MLCCVVLWPFVVYQNRCFDSASAGVFGGQGGNLEMLGKVQENVEKHRKFGQKLACWELRLGSKWATWVYPANLAQNGST